MISHKDINLILEEYSIYDTKLAKALTRNIQKYAEEETRALFKQEWEAYKNLQKAIFQRNSEELRILSNIYDTLGNYFGEYI